MPKLAADAVSLLLHPLLVLLNDSESRNRQKRQIEIQFGSNAEIFQAAKTIRLSAALR